MVLRDHSASAWLLVLNGRLRGRQYRLAGSSIAIGRSPNCEVHIDDPSVSRQQARIYLENNRFWVADLGARAPTYVNSIPIAQAELRDRDEIQVGNTILLFIQAVTPEDLTAEAKNRLRQFDSVWDQLTDSIRHDS
jgi:pSer/pThr/pTyr-binding forkhead associated (FHA) protein